MGRVVDVAAAAFVEVNRYGQVKNREYVTRYGYGYEEETHRCLWKENQHGEDHRRHRTGSAEASEMVTVLVPQVVGQAGNNQRCEIKHQVKQFSPLTKNAGEAYHRFQSFAKRIQRNHIECKVYDIGMNEAMGNEPVPLVSFYRRRIKDEVIDDLLITEPANRYQCRYNNNNQGNRKFHV